jgi:hypothetical protein
MRASIRCVLTLAIFFTAACHRMKPVSVAQVTATNRVWLTLGDQSVVVVDGPQIYGTKLVGWVNGRYGEFPTSEVKEVYVREPASGRTAVLVAGGVLAGTAVMVWVFGSMGKGPHTPDICDEEPLSELCG